MQPDPSAAKPDLSGSIPVERVNAHLTEDELREVHEGIERELLGSSAAYVDDWCEHWVERDGCVFCTNPGADVRDGFCPNHEPSSTWHVVHEDGSSRCCACGHEHEYRPGYLERNRG